MENENVIEQIEVQESETSRESVNETYENNTETNDSNLFSSSGDLLYFQLIDEQYNNIFNTINNILHCNFILCSLILAILLYLFLHNIGERRKI